MESRPFRPLKRINAISTLQSESLDEAALASIYNAHISNQMGKKRALIKGRINETFKRSIHF